MRINNAQPQDPIAAGSIYGTDYEKFATVAAVAGQSSLVQLWGASGVVTFAQIIDILVSLATAGDVIISSSGTALATDAGLGNSTYPNGGQGNWHVRTATAAAIPGTQMSRYSVPASQSTSITRPFLYTLTGGLGIVVAAVTVNVALTVTFRWIESTG